MNTNITMRTAEITDKEDLRSLFNVDAQFVNQDNQYFENHSSEDEIPFDSVLKRHDWMHDLDKVVRLLGEKLLDFDSDFVHFDYEILDIKGCKVVSVVFANLEY